MISRILLGTLKIFNQIDHKGHIVIKVYVPYVPRMFVARKKNVVKKCQHPSRPTKIQNYQRDYEVVPC